MGRPKRQLLATADATLNPPDNLTASQSIARVVRAAGNNLYYVELPTAKEALVELPAKFRNTIWIKRGTYVLVDRQAMAERENKLDGEIVNVVRDEKEWRKQRYWPAEFKKVTSYPEDSDEEESTVGKMPPSDSEEES